MIYGLPVKREKIVTRAFSAIIILFAFVSADVLKAIFLIFTWSHAQLVGWQTSFVVLGLSLWLSHKVVARWLSLAIIAAMFYVAALKVLIFEASEIFYTTGPVAEYSLTGSSLFIFASGALGCFLLKDARETALFGLMLGASLIPLAFQSYQYLAR